MVTCLELDLKYKGKVGMYTCCVGFGGRVSWVCYLKVIGSSIFLNLRTLFCLICVGSKYILAMRVLLGGGGVA